MYIYLYSYCTVNYSFLVWKFNGAFLFLFILKRIMSGRFFMLVGHSLIIIIIMPLLQFG